MKKKNERFRENLLLCLLGCFSMTQVAVVGYIGISELVCYLIAPWLFIVYYKDLRERRLTLFFGLTAMWAFSAILSDYLHDRDWITLLKGVAPVYSYFSVGVVVFALCRNSFSGFKWFLLGSFISSIICVFVFQPGSDIVQGDEVLKGNAAVEAVMGYKLFWSSRIVNGSLLLVKAMFLKLPFLFSMVLVAGNASYALLQGSRSAFLMLLIAMVLLFFGRQTITGGLRRVNVVLVVGSILLMVLAGYIGYKVAVHSGIMGEDELAKYEMQSTEGESPLKLLMAGRSEFFVALFAIADAPVIGHGSKAIDTKGYYARFTQKYGNPEDYARFERAMAGRDFFIPVHSHILQAWLWHGLGGLFFWLYVFRIVSYTLIKRLFFERELFAFFALSLPASVWNILFSPMGSRVQTAFMIMMCLMVMKTRKHRERVAPFHSRDNFR